ncbi:glycosyltransferase family 4 protein [Paludibacterium yongneupense]|uniref:glycosyltransferase family 4 protein n=1 Tax=Paludibacterium yongneupense TaxID=400061 RepID=UPI000491400F|nr:glycosyltransferase family 1 protein [Paludibacterium yongneupense]
MRVLYTYDIFTKQAYGGISRYIMELVKHAPSSIDPRVFAGLHINAYASGKAVSGLKLRDFPGAGGMRDRISRTSQAVYSRLTRPDLIHRTYYGPESSGGRCPVVLTVYDMIHERFPEQYNDSGALTARKLANCKSADHIIAISESTKQDLIEYFGIPETKIEVIYLAATESEGRPSLPSASTVNGRPFILFVGARGGYKNFDSLLAAFSASERLRSEVDLVCFGGGAATSTEKQKVNDLGLSSSVHFAGGDDRQLNLFYKNARLLVYPSLYEGFGLPVLEAMQLGCPVMCHRISSLPEVAGAAAEYIGPDFTEQLAALVFDESKLAQLRGKGLIQSRTFSWIKCAEETAALYKSIAAN